MVWRMGRRLSGGNKGEPLHVPSTTRPDPDSPKRRTSIGKTKSGPKRKLFLCCAVSDVATDQTREKLLTQPPVVRRFARTEGTGVVATEIVDQTIIQSSAIPRAYFHFIEPSLIHQTKDGAKRSSVMLCSFEGTERDSRADGDLLDMNLSPAGFPSSNGRSHELILLTTGRIKYAFKKKRIDEAIDELETWQGVFDISWLLTSKIANREVDDAVAKSPVASISPSMPTTTRLRAVIARPLSTIAENVFLGADYHAVKHYLSPPYVLEPPSANGISVNHTPWFDDADIQGVCFYPHETTRRSLSSVIAELTIMIAHSIIGSQHWRLNSSDTGEVAVMIVLRKMLQSALGQLVEGSAASLLLLRHKVGETPGHRFWRSGKHATRRELRDAGDHGVEVLVACQQIVNAR
ncbi:hypothetical protein CHU98_g10628 [Xylaria longipes]|nr:hypothetical protein CHU98_g10628 [Xylaria longipes]